MPKLNLVGMIVLCLAVTAGAVTLALRTPTPSHDGPQVDHLIRCLGDADPDLRREAERELKQLGRKAEPALKIAANGSDPELAQRARALLGVKPPEPPKVARDSSAAAPDPVPLPAEVRLSLQIGASPGRPEEPVTYYLRLHNGTRSAVAVARRKREGGCDYRGFGAFERIDAEGRVVVGAGKASDEDDDRVEFVVVAPGESLDLMPGAGLLRMGASGTFRVRYVYEAGEGSEYREKFASGHHAGAALPAERLASNSVTI